MIVWMRQLPLTSLLLLVTVSGAACSAFSSSDSESPPSADAGVTPPGTSSSEGGADLASDTGVNDSDAGFTCSANAFCDDFERADVTGAWSRRSGAAGGLSIVAIDGRTRALRSDLQQTESFLELDHPTALEAPFRYRLRFQAKSELPPEGRVVGPRLVTFAKGLDASGASDRLDVNVQFEKEKVLVTTYAPSCQPPSCTPPDTLSANLLMGFHDIELEIDAATVGGTIRLRVDGTLAGTTALTFNLTTARARSTYFGATFISGVQSGELLLDDASIELTAR